MGGTLKSLLVKLGVDNKALDKGLDHAEKRSKNLEKTFQGLTKVGMGITMGVAAGVGATALALATTIKPASDLEEAINAVNVVFGDNAKQMTDYGKGAALAVGLSAREFNQMGAEMGAMLGNVGIAEDELAGETINLMERASDMASIFNTDVDQAFAAIQSAIKGEFNPLEQFGVKMNQAAIDAKAMEMGLADANGELTDSAKAQAALALVYEQTDKVAGDFQNTSDGLANSQRILKATLEDTKAKVGAALLPAMEGLAKTFKDIASSEEFKDFLDKIIEGVGKLSDWILEKVPIWISNFRKFSDWLSENKGVVVGVLAAMGVAVIAFGISVATAAWTAMVPLLPVIALMLAIAAIAYLVYEAWTNNWGGIQEKVAVVTDFVVYWINYLKVRVLQIWNKLWAAISPIFDAFKSAFEGDWTAFGEKIREAWDNVWELVKTAISTAFENIKTAVLEWLPKIKEWFLDIDWKQLGIDIIQGIANGITSAASFIKDAAVNAATAAWDAVKGFLGIDSPSKLFADLGKFSMLGMAGGIDDYAQVPAMATMDATRGIATTAGHADYPAAAPAQPVLDEAKLSRMIRDAILKVMEL